MRHLKLIAQCFIASILVLLPNICPAQPTIIPTLHQQLVAKQKQRNFEGDTSYINLLNELSKRYYSLNADSMRSYASTALNLAKKAGYLRGQVQSLNLIANSYRLSNDVPLMLSNYLLALAMAEKINDSLSIAGINRNMAMYYAETNRFDEAVKDIRKSYSIMAALNNKPGMANALSDFSDIFSFQKKYDSAIYYQEKALAIGKEIHDDYIIAFTNSGIGIIHFQLKEYTKALQCFIPSFNYYIGTKDKLGQIHTSTLIAQSYMAIAKSDSAIRYALLAYNSARSINIKREIMEAASILASSYETKADIDNAYAYFKQYKTYSDSIFNENSRLKAYELETKYAQEKKDEQQKDNQSRKDLIINAQLKHQRQETLLALLSAILLCIASAGLLISRANKQKTNQLLRDKNIEINQQKAAIELQAKELAINNQLKDSLFSILSHDLRAPLVTLQNVLKLFQKNKLSITDMDQLITSIDSEINNTTDLILGLLYWANSQKNGLRVTPTIINLQDIANKTIELFAMQAKEKSLVMYSSVPINTMAYADKDMVQAVFRNLVSNAIKFSNPEGQIVISAQATPEQKIEIGISDTGIGIEEDILNKILNQESITTYGTQSEKGTGLGLMLCKDFIAKNKGTFWIESEVGKGSNFYFTLPTMPVTDAVI